jgi:hypothetical protein
MRSRWLDERARLALTDAIARIEAVSSVDWVLSRIEQDDAYQQ